MSYVLCTCAKLQKGGRFTPADYAACMLLLGILAEVMGKAGA